MRNPKFFLWRSQRGSPQRPVLASRPRGPARWTFDRLWEEWKACNANKHGLVVDDNRYRIHLKKPFGDKEPKDVSAFEVLPPGLVEVLKKRTRAKGGSKRSSRRSG
jgi:hypothetical protein